MLGKIESPAMYEITYNKSFKLTFKQALCAYEIVGRIICDY